MTTNTNKQLKNTLIAVVAVIIIIAAGYFYNIHKVNEIVHQKWQDEMRREWVNAARECNNDSTNLNPNAVR